LNLDPQVTTGIGDVHAVRETFDCELLVQNWLEALEIVGHQDQVQIETDHRVGVCVDRLFVDDAEAHVMFSQRRQEPAEQVRSVRSDGRPEIAALHWASVSSDDRPRPVYDSPNSLCRSLERRPVFAASGPSVFTRSQHHLKRAPSLSGPGRAASEALAYDQGCHERRRYWACAPSRVLARGT
jgi:hypothetical protein